MTEGNVTEIEKIESRKTVNRPYIEKLNDHPGVPVAFLFTFLGYAGAGMVGALVIAAFAWGLVLYSNLSRD